ncbi:MAG: PP2C family protein-serine/threonine phosphatase, partial [Acidobacteriota bacterium]
LLLTPDGAFAGCVAGHPPILRVGPDGAVRERIGTGAYPLGIRGELTWDLVSRSLEPGEALFLHSDGLSEARNAAGAEFGDARIEAAIRRGIGRPAPELAAEVAADMHSFLDGQSAEDDVSVAVVRRRG